MILANDPTVFIAVENRSHGLINQCSDSKKFSPLINLAALKKICSAVSWAETVISCNGIKGAYFSLSFQL